MKKFIFLFMFACACNFSQAQKVYAWADVGLKAGYGLTGLINTNLFDDRDYEHHLSTGTSFGAKVGLFFGLFNGLTVDFLLSNSNQKFDFNRDGKNFLHDIKWKNYDIAVLYRMQKDGIYVELGPQYSLVNKVTHKDTYTGAPNGDVSDKYVENYFAGVFGLGGYLLNYENFTTMLGFRMGYGFKDLVNAEGKIAKFPTPSSAINYTSVKSTNPAWVQLMLEFNFALGYYGRSSCSKRATLFKF